MGLWEIFSKRQKKLRGDIPDIYQYKTIPDPLRVQIVHIWHDTLGQEAEYHDSYNGTRGAYELIATTLCREYGVFSLPGTTHYGDRDYLAELANFVLTDKDAEKVLDAVELSFQVVDRLTRQYSYLRRSDASKRADDAIEELNARFREHGVGFQFADGEMIRVDSELLHTEVVKPALALLRGSHYAGAQDEFLKAHEHYRHGNTKEALEECLKAFESTMKSICAKRGWKHDARATSSVLIQTCFAHGLVPDFWASHFSGLRAMLEGGVPPARNRLGGHGQGSAIVEVPAHLAAYALHMTAATIVFLAEAERGLK